MNVPEQDRGHGDGGRGKDTGSTHEVVTAPEGPVQKGSRPVRVSTEALGAWWRSVQPATRPTEIQ